VIAERPRKNVHRLGHSMAIVSSSTNDAISLHSVLPSGWKRQSKGCAIQSVRSRNEANLLIPFISVQDHSPSAAIRNCGIGLAEKKEQNAAVVQVLTLVT